MPLFQYVGYYDRMYGGIKAADGRDLFVKQGDTAELDEAPADGMWVPVEDKAPEIPESPEVPLPVDPAPEAPAEG